MNFKHHCYVLLLLLVLLGSQFGDQKIFFEGSRLVKYNKNDANQAWIGLSSYNLQQANGIQVNGALVELKGNPGLVYIHHMVISSGGQYSDVEIRVGAAGLGQNPDGSFVALKPDQDLSPYSAYSFITAISNPLFSLFSGNYVPVDVTISVPDSFMNNSDYAAILIECLPAGSENSPSVGVLTSYIVPVIVEPDPSHNVETAAIQQFTLGPITLGQPISLSLQVKNTGNHHFKFKGRVTLLDPNGQTAAVLNIPLEGISLLPTFYRTVQMTIPSLSQVVSGRYSANVEIMNEDGVVLATATTQSATSTPNPQSTNTYTPNPQSTNTSTPTLPSSTYSYSTITPTTSPGTLQVLTGSPSPSIYPELTLTVSSGEMTEMATNTPEAASGTLAVKSTGLTGWQEIFTSSFLATLLVNSFRTALCLLFLGALMVALCVFFVDRKQRNDWEQKRSSLEEKNE